MAAKPETIFLCNLLEDPKNITYWHSRTTGSGGDDGVKDTEKMNRTFIAGIPNTRHAYGVTGYYIQLMNPQLGWEVSINIECIEPPRSNDWQNRIQNLAPTIVVSITLPKHLADKLNEQYQVKSKTGMMPGINFIMKKEARFDSDTKKGLCECIFEFNLWDEEQNKRRDSVLATCDVFHCIESVPELELPLPIKNDFYKLYFRIDSYSYFREKMLLAFYDQDFNPDVRKALQFAYKTRSPELLLCLAKLIKSNDKSELTEMFAIQNALCLVKKSHIFRYYTDAKTMQELHLTAAKLSLTSPLLFEPNQNMERKEGVEKEAKLNQEKRETVVRLYIALHHAVRAGNVPAIAGKALNQKAEIKNLNESQILCQNIVEQLDRLNLDPSSSVMDLALRKVNCNNNSLHPIEARLVQMERLLVSANVKQITNRLSYVEKLVQFHADFRKIIDDKGMSLVFERDSAVFGKKIAELNALHVEVDKCCKEIEARLYTATVPGGPTLVFTMVGAADSNKTDRDQNDKSKVKEKP